MRLAGTEVEAISIGGLETCIELPGWNLCFDIGRCPPSAVKRARVLITHAHMDHAGGIAMHAATRDLLGLPPPTYYVPRSNAEDFESLFAVWRRLDKSELPCTLVPCGPGDTVELGDGRFLRPFRSPHRVFCQGYALGRTRSRLRAELHGLPEAEIRRRATAGESVSERFESIDVAFTGDTLADVLDREPLLAAAKLLIIEVTFFDDRVPVAAARSKGHVHLDELVERADRLTNDALLFTHASARYDHAQIERLLDAKLPAELRRRVTALAPPTAGR
jgi:ribonuclease Z